MENTITFDSPIACLDYVKNITIQENILSSIDRKKLFKARQYFVAHFTQFLEEDIKFLLTNEHFKNFTNLQVETLIINCNLNNITLPVSLQQLEMCEIKNLTPYLQNIAEKNPEQLESYFSKERNKNIILGMFHEKKIIIVSLLIWQLLMIQLMFLNLNGNQKKLFNGLIVILSII